MSIDKRPIVVAVDSTNSSRHALEKAIKIAKKMLCEVYAVHYVYHEEIETFARWFPEPGQDGAIIAGRKSRIMSWIEALDAWQ